MGGVAGIADVSEGVGFIAAVTDLPVQAQGALVASGGLVVLAEVMVGVAKAVPCAGLPLLVV